LDFSPETVFFFSDVVPLAGCSSTGYKIADSWKAQHCDPSRRFGFSDHQFPFVSDVAGWFSVSKQELVFLQRKHRSEGKSKLQWVGTIIACD
jgi:hypothetical protein